MEHGKIQNDSINLVDINKHGSLIVGDYRCGSHFVEVLCQRQAEKLKLNCRINGEWKSNDISMFTRSKTGHSDGIYPISIVNLLDQKIKILESDWINDWHVIRIVHDDIYRWFISLYFFLLFPDLKTKVSSVKEAKIDNKDVWFVGDGDGGNYYDKISRLYIVSWHPDRGNFFDEKLLGVELNGENAYHHGTDIEIYQKAISEYTLLPLPSNFWMTFQHHLYNRFLTAMVPADVDINYTDLASMATQRTPWMPNQYPDLDIEKSFEDGIYIKSLLDKWKDPLPLKSKDTK